MKRIIKRQTLKPYYENEHGKLYHGDCLEVMPKLNIKFDMVLCDPPYGTTSCKWDSVIPFEPMWGQLKALINNNVAIILFGSEPFSSYLRMSNIKQYKYDWTWDKTTAKGHLVAKIRPMQQTEIISVFGEGKIHYYPQMIDRKKTIISHEAKRTEIMGGISNGYKKQYTQWYPKTLLTVKTERGLHPTQKPVALMEYLIRTYTNEGEVILDFAAGSGTTAIAAQENNRKWVLIEKEEKYCEIIKNRLEGTL